MRKTRVEVTLNVVDDESEDGGLMREWAHDEDVEQGEWGISLRFDHEDEVFFPWMAVARVDRRLCSCFECAPNAIRAKA